VEITKKILNGINEILINGNFYEENKSLDDDGNKKE